MLINAFKKKQVLRKNLEGGAISQARGAFSNWWSTLTTIQPLDVEARSDLPGDEVQKIDDAPTLERIDVIATDLKPPTVTSTADSTVAPAD